VRFKLIAAITILVMLCCTKGVVPKASKIEVLYLGSIYEDIFRENPNSAGISKFPGVRVAHVLTEPEFMEYFLQSNGLPALLDELGFDFVIADTAIPDHRYFTVVRSMGFAIKNFGGIRFALLSCKDSMTIDDQVKLSLVKERSDVLWVVDDDLLKLPPSIINFYINNRVLTDTSILPIKATPDESRMRQVVAFRERIENELNRKIHIAGRVDDHLFSVLARKQEAGVIIYPASLFTEVIEADSASLRTLMQSVAFGMRLKKTVMSDDEINELCTTRGYLKWGKMEKANTVLVPDEVRGQYIFNLYYEKE
jgi:hypothetical protein